MKLIYTSQDRLLVWHIKNKLELSGFDCHIRNEYAAGAVGDIAPIETWPEVWIDDEYRYDEALKILESTILNPKNTGVDWTCPECGESNASSFEFCWNCQYEIH